MIGSRNFARSYNFRKEGFETGSRRPFNGSLELRTRSNRLQRGRRSVHCRIRPGSGREKEQSQNADRNQQTRFADDARPHSDGKTIQRVRPAFNRLLAVWTTASPLKSIRSFSVLSVSSVENRFTNSPSECNNSSASFPRRRSRLCGKSLALL